MRNDDITPNHKILDEQGTIGGLSPYRSNYKNKEIKRNPKWCPRCYNPMVSKDLRKCLKCNGRLLWWGDDLQLHFDGYEDFYVWYKSIFNFEGWYHSSYFTKFKHEHKSNVK